MYDVIIIGAGVSGCAAARELSKFQLKIGVLEKEEDVCTGTSKANSAIIHAGFDAQPGSLMAKLNVRGNQMLPELAKQLDFEFIQNGAFVVCFSEEELIGLERLYEQGVQNGVRGLQILNRDEIHEMEPHLAENVYAALYAPESGIVCPFGMNIAFAENAYDNGVEFHFHTQVKNISRIEEGWSIQTNQGEYTARCIVNAAGVYADIIHNMVSDDKIQIIPRKGEYCLFDKAIGDYVKRTVFQLPGKLGKGVLVTPTVHGNLLVGPTATDTIDREGTNTTAEGLEELLKKAELAVEGIPKRSVITSFAGLRAHEQQHEFIIKELEDAKGFVDCAGIESPGLSSSPAIGEYVAEIVTCILKPEKNEHFIGERKGMLHPASMDLEERNELIRRKPEYGTIICRCEMISEGEILEAIHRSLGTRSLDAVKRRTRAGMGRCQSGFCSPKVMEILARELDIPMEDVTKSGAGSQIIIGGRE